MAPNGHTQSIQLPLRPPQPTHAHRHRCTAAITTVIHDPRLESPLVEDDWLLVSSPSGPGTEGDSSADSNTTTTSVNRNNRNNLRDHHQRHNGKRLTTSNLALLDLNNANEHAPRRSGKAQCKSLMALGVAAMSSSVESVDKVLPGEPLAPENAFPYDFELSFVGGWANEPRPL